MVEKIDENYKTPYEIMCDMCEHPRLFQELSFKERIELEKIILEKLKEFMEDNNDSK